MTKLREVCRHIRTKQAGPFWITCDVFFDDDESFRRYCNSQALSADTFAEVFGVDAALVKHIPVPNLQMVKVSFPRPTPQGGMVERDMHAGQQYVRLLDLAVE